MHVIFIWIKFILDLCYTFYENHQTQISYRKVNLNASTSDDAHEEIGNNASNGHHQALDDSHTRVKTQNEEDVVFESGMQAHHEIAYSPRKKGDQHQEWHC